MGYRLNLESRISYTKYLYLYRLRLLNWKMSWKTNDLSVKRCVSYTTTNNICRVQFQIGAHNTEV